MEFISPDISNYEINMDDLIFARNKRKKLLKQKIQVPISVELLLVTSGETYSLCIIEYVS